MRFTHAASPENLFLHWLKFNLVGAMGTLVQLAVLSFTTEVLGMDYLLATALAVEAAVVHNFVWHDRFTWVERSGLAGRRLARFFRFNLTTGAISVAGNLMSTSLLVEQVHLSVLSANLLAIAFCSPASYVAADRVVFRTRGVCQSPLSLNTSKPFICVRPWSSTGRSTLSTIPTTTEQINARVSARPRCPPPA